MKQNFFIFLMLSLVAFIPSYSQSLLTDGKVWNCVQRMYNDDAGEYNRPYTVTVCGDSIVQGLACKRLARAWSDVPDDMIYFAAREQDSHVYLVTDEGQSEFLNFNPSVGDADGIEGCVTAIDYITVNGISRKRITIERWGHKQYIVEGIGLSDDWLRYGELNSFYNVLLSVTEYGNVVFLADDFTSTATGLSEVNTRSQRAINVEYINLAGMSSDKPWSGVNLKLTTYDDGSVTTVKVIPQSER